MRRRGVLTALATAATAGCLGPLAPDAVRLARVTLYNAAPQEQAVAVTVRRAGETVYDDRAVLAPDSGNRQELPEWTVSGEWPAEPSRFEVAIDPGADGDGYEYAIPDGSKLGRCYAVSATVTGGDEMQFSSTSYASGCRE